ncbi:hypothetical protein FF1_034624 [Malus domestica]
MPVAEALANGHTLAFSLAILAHLLRCLAVPSGSSNSGCRSTLLRFGQRLPISRLRKRSALSWLFGQSFLTKPKKCSYTFSLLTTFLMTSS